MFDRQRQGHLELKRQRRRQCDQCVLGGNGAGAEEKSGLAEGLCPCGAVRGGTGKVARGLTPKAVGHQALEPGCT